MKNLKLNLLAILVAFVAASQPGFAQDDGFVVEDSIRQQIFLELQSNVHSLYRGLDLLVPEIDQAEVARIAHSQSGESLILPANASSDIERESAVVETIN